MNDTTHDTMQPETLRALLQRAFRARSVRGLRETKRVIDRVESLLGREATVEDLRGDRLIEIGIALRASATTSHEYDTSIRRLIALASFWHREQRTRARSSIRRDEPIADDTLAFCALYETADTKRPLRAVLADGERRIVVRLREHDLSSYQRFRAVVSRSIGRRYSHRGVELGGVLGKQVWQDQVRTAREAGKQVVIATG